MVIADIACDLPQRGPIVGIFPALNPAAKQAAQDSAEIVVPRVLQEAARVGQHANKARQIAEIRQRDHLLGDALNVIVEPPC